MNKIYGNKRNFLYPCDFDNIKVGNNGRFKVKGKGEENENAISMRLCGDETITVAI